MKSLWITILLCSSLLLLAPVIRIQGPPHNVIVGGSTLNNNLAVYYKLDELSDPRVDSEPTGTPQDLSDINTVTNTTGIIGNAAFFTLANQEILMHSDSVDLSVGGGTFTVTAWAKGTTLAVDAVVASQWMVSPSQRAWRLWFNSSLGKFDLSVSADGVNSTDVIANSSGPLVTNVWYFLAAGYNGTNITISVNNGAVDSVAYSAGIKDSTGSFMIGARETSNWWDGAIDEVGLWKRALTATEITELYNAGAGKTCCPF